MSFESLRLDPALLAGVRDLGFTKPTPVQADAIPVALEGRDVLASAATGSGKTAAFLLPVLHRLLRNPRRGTRALVLAPTRELALQILEDLEGLARHTRIKGAAVYGGVGMEAQEKAFRRGADVIVATPGRLLDHFQYDYATLSQLEVLVLDEADRMLDMGFLPDIRRILAHVPKPEQTLFFSATMPPPIEALTRNILVDPVRVTLQKRAAPARGVTQVVYPVPEKRKAALLLALLDQGIVEDALVFTRTKHRADRLTRVLVKHGVRAERIHGNRSQPQRTRALDGFKQGDFQILVATDIAARGIDVEALGHVVNFDVPTVPEDYIHRSGRTGRAQATGEAVTLVSPEEEGTLRQIQRAVGATLPRRTLAGFAYHDDSDAPLEVPLAERIAEIRARKKADRERAREKAAAKEARAAGTQSRAADDRSVEDRPGSGSGEGAGRRRRRRGGKRKTQEGKASAERRGSTPAQRDAGPSSPRGKGPAAGRGKKSSPGRGTPGRSAGGGETRPGGGETERSGPPQQGRRPHTRRRRP